MTTVASGSEVFEMAIAMERIGRDFYVALAMSSDNEDVRAFCLRAAQDEKGHEAAFQEMYKLWAAGVKAKRVSAEDALTLGYLAKGHIQPDARAVRKVALGGKLDDALALAMKLEQGSIDFYTEISARVPASAEVIQKIVSMEQGHLARLRRLAGGGGDGL